MTPFHPRSSTPFHNSTAGNSWSMAASQRPSPQHVHVFDQGQSPDAGSSAAESETEQQASPGAKRKRPLTVSCELCKQRKVKCDRAQPSCGWCKRNSQVCEYKERKKPGLRAGYGKELEQRLDRLEEIIQSQARLIETHIVRNQAPESFYTQSQNVRVPSYPSYGSPSELSPATGPSPHTAVYAGETSSFSRAPGPLDSAATNQRNAAVTSPSASSIQIHNHPSMVSNSVSHSTPHSQVPDGTGGDFSHNDSSLTVPVSLFNNQEKSLSDSELDLPPYDLLYALVDLYFERINSWCPILHRRSTLDTLFGPSPLEEADRVVLHAIVATTLRFSLDPRLNAVNRSRYHESSKQRVLLYGLENSSVKAIQALVILSLDFVGSSNGPPGWKLLALIARSVVQMGLAVERGSGAIHSTIYPSIYTLRANILPDPETWIEEESRRRLFWMVYLLDRYSTIATAFDFALDDKEIDRRLPCREEFFIRNQPVETRWLRSTIDRGDYTGGHGDNVGSFGYYIEILGILSRIHLFLKRPVDIGALSDVEEWQATYRKLDSELSAWEFNLPTEYAHENASRLFQSSKTKKGFQCDWVMLHATYQTTVIRLHSSAAYPTTRSPIFTPSYSASQRCLVAVDNILTLTRFVAENNMLDKLGPPFAFSLWVSARLLLVHGSTIAHTVSPDIHVFVDTLAQMGQYWKVAERYSTILKRVLDEFAEYEQAAGTEDERGGTPSSVKILADMRRCAFDLDFLISRQPPRSSSSQHKNKNGPSYFHSLGGSLQAAGGRSSVIGGSSATDSTTPPPLPPHLAMNRNLTHNEFEYLDIFGFFNVPRVPNMSTPLSALGMATTSTTTTDNQNNSSSSITNPMSIHGLTAAVGHNEFNITNYLVPTPETDWLFPQPGG